MNWIVYLIGFLSPIILLLLVLLASLAVEKISDLLADRKSHTSKWLYRYYNRVCQYRQMNLTDEQKKWRKQTLDDLDDFIKGNKL